MFSQHWSLLVCAEARPTLTFPSYSELPSMETPMLIPMCCWCCRSCWAQPICVFGGCGHSGDAPTDVHPILQETVVAVSAGLHLHSRGHSHCDCCCGHGPAAREDAAAGEPAPLHHCAPVPLTDPAVTMRRQSLPSLCAASHQA